MLLKISLDNTGLGSYISTYHSIFGLLLVLVIQGASGDEGRRGPTNLLFLLVFIGVWWMVKEYVYHNRKRLNTN
jgi:hypothetical protein